MADGLLVQAAASIAAHANEIVTVVVSGVISISGALIATALANKNNEALKRLELDRADATRFHQSRLIAYTEYLQIATRIQEAAVRCECSSDIAVSERALVEVRQTIQELINRNPGIELLSTSGMITKSKAAAALMTGASHKLEERLTVRRHGGKPPLDLSEQSATAMITTAREGLQKALRLELGLDMASLTS